jgi:protein-L-isoaspartate O-methyltransferase
MIAWTYVIVLAGFFFAASDAYGRGFRRGASATHRSGAGVHISFRGPHGFSHGSRIIVPRTPLKFTRIVPAPHGFVKVAPVPVFVTPVAPGFHHFGRPFVSGGFPRRGGILILDVPNVVDTTIVTGVAPRSVYMDPSTAGHPQSETPGRSASQLAPFDPMPQEVVARLLVLAEVKKGDIVYDLGSGDGRVVIAAAKKFGVKAVGFEIDPGLVKLARENARKEGVEKLVQIHQQDFMTADLSPASVVTLYLSNDGNLALKPALMDQLKPGARIVSYAFDMGDWAPKIMEAYRDAAGDSHLLYLWQIAEPIASSDHSSSIP